MPSLLESRLQEWLSPVLAKGWDPQIREAPFSGKELLISVVAEWSIKDLYISVELEPDTQDPESTSFVYAHVLNVNTDDIREASFAPNKEGSELFVGWIHKILG